MKTAVDYYPEHWPRDRWKTDATMMREAGISAVRIGEFAWSRIEPVEGAFETGWLLESIDLLADHGISVILGTPTPTYPPWLHRKYPDIHIVRSNGRIVEYGQRQDACKNHPGYRAAAIGVTRRLSNVAGMHPNVLAWQIDNELGCHDTARCFCAHCEASFQQWLDERYQGDVCALNAAWGTVFWSQEYSSFSEISVPRETAEELPHGGSQNPGLMLDYFRFSSDVQVRFQRDLINAVREHSDRPVTHNLMGGYSRINYFDLARDLDVVAWDNYPFMSSLGSPKRHQPFAHDLMRGLKKQRTWVMEQAAGPGGWNFVRPEVEPARMRLWAYQAIARGSELISFFRWRTAPFGTEQFWHGILHHHGQKGRRLAELTEFNAELSRISERCDGYSVVEDVALLFDFETLWSYETQPMVASGFDYRQFATDIVHQLAALGLTTVIVEPGAEFPEVPLLIVPSLRIGAERIVEQLQQYVRKGGSLLLGPRSGARTAVNAIVQDLLPGCLRDLAGVTISEYDVFSGIPDFEMPLADTAGATTARGWGLAEILDADAETTAELNYGARYYSGSAAATAHPYGDGVCRYLGTKLEGDDLRRYLESIARNAGLPLVDDLDECLEVVRARVRAGALTFYLNHADRPVEVLPVRPGRDLGCQVDGIPASPRALGQRRGASGTSVPWCVTSRARIA